ncbi:uncharacterized protein LOC108735045 isoform X3 [Agrilus planipennis]|uniref:Uncharacterized protein LOC108735045 isoform X3 n=1 Tax=Agrilus planipennis TaxID=224129 RepID=A0A1W4WEF4_AGRPL|nr:uncharacterized protein LOC108735045 isoform X3 [Agrilus planipennis]
MFKLHKKMTYYNINKICRICLLEKPNMNSLLDPVIGDIFTYCTSLAIVEKDKYPAFICRECEISMHSACSFKRQCYDSCMKLENFLNTPQHQDVNNIHEIKEDQSKQDDLFSTISFDIHLDNNEISEDDQNISQLRPEIKKNERRREHKFNCNFCKEGVDYEEDLQIHMVAHPQDCKPLCTICNKTFADMNVLKRHNLED